MEERNTNPNISTVTLVKSSFWYTVSGFLTRAIGFITIPIFTRILTKEQIGNFSVYASWQSIFVIICGMEIYNTINRARFDYKGEKQFDSYITSCLLLSTGVTAVVFVLYLLFPQLFYRFLLIDHKYMIIMFLYLFTFPAYSMFQMKQRVKYKYKLSAGIAFVLVVSSSLLAVVLASCLTDDRLFGRIFGQYIMYIIVGFVFYLLLIRKSLAVKPDYFKYALRIGLPLVFSFLGSSILLSSDNFVVKHMCTDVQVSYLALTHSAAHIILLLVQMLNSAWAPWLYDKLNNKQYPSIRKTYKVYVWLIIAGTFGVLLLGPELILILGGRQYHEAVYILPANILSGVFTVLTANMVDVETFHYKPRYAAIITGAVAVINVLLNIAGVYLWDYRAVCYVTVVCNVTAVLIHYFFTGKMSIREMIIPRDLALFLGTSLTMIPVMLLLYQNDVVRYVVIAVVFTAVITAVIVKRKLVIKVVKKHLPKKQRTESQPE